MGRIGRSTEGHAGVQGTEKVSLPAGARIFQCGQGGSNLDAGHLGGHYTHVASLRQSGPPETVRSAPHHHINMSN